MSGTRREYRGDKIVVTFDPRRCIHAKRCVHGLPEVFDADRRPWIAPDSAHADKVAETVARCPTGALKFERLDGGPEETRPDASSITAEKNGPLYCRGEFVIKGHDDQVLTTEYRVALCRCGLSRNKPYCEGAHTKEGWTE